MKKLIVSLGFLLPGLCLAETGVSDKEIVIGSCAALTGPAKDAGTRVVEGGRVYFDQINEAGGVHGRKIRLISADDGYEPDKAIACFQELLKENIFAGALFYGTPACAKHSTLAENNKIPAVGFASGASFLYENPFKRYVFNVRANVADETALGVRRLLDEYKPKKIGVIYQDDASGVSFFNHIDEQLKKRGVGTVALGTIKRNSKEVEEAVQKVRNANPDAVFLLGNFAPLAEVLKRAKELGWKPLFVAIGPRDPLVKAAGPAAEGVVISQVVPPPDRNDLKSIALYHKAMKRFAPKSEPNFYGLEGYLDAIALVEGLRRAGRDLTREKLVSSLETLGDWDIGLGSMKLNFGPKDHRGLDHAFYTVVRNGRLILVDDWSKLGRK